MISFEYWKLLRTDFFIEQLQQLLLNHSLRPVKQRRRQVPLQTSAMEKFAKLSILDVFGSSGWGYVKIIQFRFLWKYLKCTKALFKRWILILMGFSSVNDARVYLLISFPSCNLSGRESSQK